MAGAAASVASPALAQSAPEVRWRLTSSFPKSIDTIYGAAETLARMVSEATDGKFQIQCFAAGEIAPGQQALDVVTSGAVECAHTPTYFYAGKDVALALGTGLPFGLNARHQHAWWHFEGGEAIINEALAKFNAIGFVCGNSGAQMGGWYRKELKSTEDLQGMKMRIGGLGGHVLAKLGVVPQQLAVGDTYAALERGTIDAAEFVGPYDDEKLGFYKVAKYYYYPGFWEGGAMMHLLVGKSAYEKLPKAYQGVLKACCEAANNWMIGKYDAVNAAALVRLIQNGAELRAFPQSILDAARASAEALFAQYSAQNALFKKGYDSQLAFARQEYAWWQIADFGFDAMQIRALRR